MFHRITYESWTTIVPIIGFILTFGVFIAIVIRAILMKKKKRDHLANLPLENENTSPDHGKED
ncbi:cbb3-type cytochrome c oxidase subunit 3 [Ruficoccus amylovorans]|uniref:Cbb3-type cytochrome c oxidase subunit 3 n=1 Tax=Ruficoccus amylovorans TaxID=1804625 RepID=A0A842HE47_9BACT|nr:cbb3-type cytochrome c oxidase subunit 3 [Ruficoccus amylovorans]MBC2594793.1 cbb3-type cytochrome c oxidase subunit 3 [Ruficoccus amylovorans]